jgi:hypothetical protein
MKNSDYVGTEINAIKIIGYYCTDGQYRRPYFECICVCGKIFESRAEAIKNGIAKSCGCKSSELMSVSRTLEGDTAIINRIYKNYKQTAIRRDISFELSLEQFKSFIFQNCIYCDSAPKLSIFSGSEKYGRKEKRLTYNGIDRVDSNIGYIFNNCITCCSICNRAKSDLPLEDFQQWIDQLVFFINQGKNAT